MYRLNNNYRELSMFHTHCSIHLSDSIKDFEMSKNFKEAFISAESNELAQLLVSGLGNHRLDYIRGNIPKRMDLDVYGLIIPHEMSNRLEGLDLNLKIYLVSLMPKVSLIKSGVSFQVENSEFKRMDYILSSEHNLFLESLKALGAPEDLLLNYH